MCLQSPRILNNAGDRAALVTAYQHLGSKCKPVRRSTCSCSHHVLATMAPSLPDSSRSSSTALALGATASAGVLAGFLICRAQAGGEVRRLLRGNWAVLSRQDRATAACLVGSGQGHLLRHWPQPGDRLAVSSCHLCCPVSHSLTCSARPCPRVSSEQWRN